MDFPSLPIKAHPLELYANIEEGIFYVVPLNWMLSCEVYEEDVKMVLADSNYVILEKSYCVEGMLVKLGKVNTVVNKNERTEISFHSSGVSCFQCQDDEVYATVVRFERLLHDARKQGNPFQGMYVLNYRTSEKIDTSKLEAVATAYRLAGWHAICFLQPIMKAYAGKHCYVLILSIDALPIQKL